MTTKWLPSFLIGLALLSPLSVNADILKISNATIKQVSADTAFGQCYATLNKAAAVGCTDKRVSFDCKGKFYKNGQGKQYYATALLAFSLNKKVAVWVNSEQKFDNKVCVAKRITISQ